MELQKKLQTLMQEAVDTCQVAGVNLLVYQDGKEIFYGEVGYADREEKKPISRDTIFRLYSQSKPVTAACAMKLMEEGKLDLYQCLGEFYPPFWDALVAEPGKALQKANGTVTVHDLLRMTSGIPYPDDQTPAGMASCKVFDEACARLHTDNGMTTQEFAEKMAKNPLAFHPGEKWAYGASADILGAVIEKASGKRFGEYLKEAILEPLGMTDTAFYVPKEKQDRLAKTYETYWENGKADMRLYTGDNLAINNYMDKAPAFESGGAGLASTLDDYMKFAQMLLQKGTYEGKQILKPATVEYMTGGALLDRQQACYENWVGLNGFTYSNLMRICHRPSQAGMLAREGEYGWDGWLGMYFANLPKEKITILMGTQKKDSGTFGLTRKLRNVLLSDLL